MRRCFIHSCEEKKKGVIMNCNYGLYPGGNRLRSPSVQISRVNQEAYYPQAGINSCLNNINGLNGGERSIFFSCIQGCTG